MKVGWAERLQHAVQVCEGVPTRLAVLSSDTYTSDNIKVDLREMRIDLGFLRNIILNNDKYTDLLRTVVSDNVIKCGGELRPVRDLVPQPNGSYSQTGELLAVGYPAAFLLTCHSAVSNRQDHGSNSADEETFRPLHDLKVYSCPPVDPVLYSTPQPLQRVVVPFIFTFVSKCFLACVFSDCTV
jgi:hypothetical protein